MRHLHALSKCKGGHLFVCVVIVTEISVLRVLNVVRRDSKLGVGEQVSVRVRVRTGGCLRTKFLRSL